MDNIPKLAGFDWDGANLGKCSKHGVSPQEIEALLRGTPHVAPDGKHSAQEKRYLAIGRTPAGRYVFVAFTLREKDGVILLRPISARYMHKKEVTAYEKKGASL